MKQYVHCLRISSNDSNDVSEYDLVAFVLMSGGTTPKAQPIDSFIGKVFKDNYRDQLFSQGTKIKIFTGRLCWFFAVHHSTSLQGCSKEHWKLLWQKIKIAKKSVISILWLDRTLQVLDQFTYQLHHRKAHNILFIHVYFLNLHVEQKRRNKIAIN